MLQSGECKAPELGQRERGVNRMDSSAERGTKSEKKACSAYSSVDLFQETALSQTLSRVRLDSRSSAGAL